MPGVDSQISPGLQGFEIVPVKPDFTHTLEPAKAHCRGGWTDKASGKPLAERMAHRDDHPATAWGHALSQTKTDADGRYRVSGHAD